MNYCSNCGHELGEGRYCTNCGQPVGPEDAWRTDTAERTAVPSTPPPTEPPPPHTPPPPARFPLFADEVDDEQDEHAPYDDGYNEAEPYGASESAQHRRRVWWPWLAGAAVALVVVGIGVVLLTSGDDETPAATDPTSASPAGPQHHGGKGHHQPSQDSSPDVPAGDLAATSTVTVPATAPPGQDANGNRTTYDAENMLDGQPDTAWRMAGDGTGSELVVTLPDESHLTSVGLVNGYAKTTDGIDWYHANRRIESVEWVFDDGSTVSQDLGDATALQATDVDVTTTTVTLRLVTVTAPGKGPSSRDYTAISDLSLVSG